MQKYAISDKVWVNYPYASLKPYIGTVLEFAGEPHNTYRVSMDNAVHYSPWLSEDNLTLLTQYELDFDHV